MSTLATGGTFCFERDTFSYANELLWTYQFDAATGERRTCKRTPAPSYGHHCFIMVRCAWQFLHHARFEPGLGRLPPAEYGALVRRVVRRSPRQPSPAGNRLTIPGYDGLRSFSREHESILKQNCGGAWQSYLMRSHWRMIFPVPRGHQERTAHRLREAARHGRVRVVHLVRFPQLTINHGMLVFGAEATAEGLVFHAYDPNEPARPARLTFRHDARTFFLPPNAYWMGGRVDVIEIYRGWLY